MRMREFSFSFIFYVTSCLLVANSDCFWSVFYLDRQLPASLISLAVKAVEDSTIIGTTIEPAPGRLTDTTIEILVAEETLETSAGLRVGDTRTGAN